MKSTERLFASLGRVALLLGVVFFVAAVAVWALQERLIFTPPPVPLQQGRGAERIEFTTADGARGFGFFVRPYAAASVAPSPGTIVVFHGNGDLADSWIDWAREAARRTGWTVFLAEYRGYGGVPGRPTFAGIMSDARAAVEAGRRTGGVSRVVAYGHSLGTGVATELAVERLFDAVILEAPITSVVDVGRRSLGPPLSWILPVLSRVPFAPVERVRTIRAPVWVAAGGRDEVAPEWMARAVFDAAARQGQLLVVPDAGHGTVANRGSERYWAWLGRALEAGSSQGR